MNPKSMRVVAVLLALLAFWPSGAQAQISIPDATPVSENFNAMSGTTALPANWRISRAISTTTTASAASGATSITVASTTDLAVGMSLASGGAIPAAATITSIVGSTVTFSPATTASIANGATVGFTNGNNPDYNAATNPTSVGAATTTGAVAGNSYNYGQTSSERAVGFQSSATYITPQALMARYRNNTGAVIPEMIVSFDIERYRINSTAASVSFFYSTNGSTWTAVPSGDVAASNFPTGTSTFTFASPTTVSRTATIPGINLANGADVYFRWGFSLANANSQGLSLDNVSVGASSGPCLTPSAQPTNLVFTLGTTTTINGAFTAAAGSPSGYLVVRYPAGSTPTLPTDGVIYPANTALGAGTVISSSSSTTFSNTGLTASSSYDVYVYAFNNAVCSAGPKYRTAAPLQGLIAPCASIAAPTGINFTSIGTGSLAGTLTGVTGSPTSFLVVQYASGGSPTAPTNGVAYVVNNTIGAGTVVHTGAITNFSALNLSLSTTYDFYVYAVANANCLAGPVYSSSPLVQSQATAGCPSFASTITINPTATPVDGSVYNTITAAVGQLSGCNITQPTVIQLASNYTSAGETFPLNLPAIPGASSTNTITLRPATGATNLVITSATVGFPTLQINGGTNWIIDGRAGGTGTTIALSIQNTDNTTAGSMGVRFINGAQNNILTYCDVRTANIGVSSGCIAFATSSTVGNSNNTVSFNKVHEASTGLPNVGISSVGSAGFANDNNQILNNEIYNVFAATGNSYGVYISDNTTNWTISGNSIYQTASRQLTSGSDRNYAPIASSPGVASTVTGLNISGNYIGGSAPLCGGTPTVISDNGSSSLVLRGIFMQVGTAVPTSIQGNVIANIAITSSSNSFNHSGISAVTGAMNIGTTTGNTIGSLTAANSITLTQTTSATVGRLNGIIAGIGTPGTIVIENNNIGGLAVSNSSTGTVSLAGIHANNAGFTINDNTIGSATSPLQNNTGNDSWGILLTNTTAGSTVSGNTIRNIMGSTGRAIGIRAEGGANTLSGNTITDLSTSSTQADGLVGIVNTATAAGQTIMANTIHSLHNNSIASSTWVVGIHYTGPTSGTNVIGRNLIHGLTCASTVSSSSLHGIRTLSGAMPLSIENNIIRLGLAADGSNIPAGIFIIGINLSSTGTHTAYHNTVYIGGTTSGITANTFAFQSTSTANTRTYQNNIFVNERSGGSSGVHYAYTVGGTSVNPAGLTQNHNLYRATGANSFMARFNSANISNITGMQTAIGQDASSYFCDPQFINATGNVSTLNLRIKTNVRTIVEGRGIAGTGVTTDFDGQTRSSFSPVDLGADAGNFIAEPAGCPLNWTGATSTNWHTAANWDAGTELPNATSETIIDGAATNQPELTTNTTIGHLTLTGTAQVTIPTGVTLSVTRDVSAVSSASIIGEGNLGFTGTGAQSISGTLVVSNVRNANTVGLNVATGARLILKASTTANAVLTMGGNSILNNNGSVILRSDNVGTASLGVMPATASIVGGLTVERKVPGTPGWYFLGTPIIGATFNDWSEVQPTVVPKQTANLRSFTENDQTVLTLGGRNIEENGWKVPSSLSNLINTGGQPRGHRMYLNAPILAATNGILSVTGTPFTQDVPVSLTNTAAGFGGGGWNLIANPYPSAIDWNATRFDAANTGLNMSNAVHIWNGASANYGTWTALSAGTGTGVGIASSLVASSQAFFVKTNAAGTLTFKESFKSATSVSSMRTAAVANELKFKFTQGTNWDEAALLFYPDAQDMADQYDADNMPSAVDISTSHTMGSKLAINVMGALSTSAQVPVNITGAVGAASITFSGMGSFDAGTSIILVDNYTGLRHDLVQNPTVNFSITAAAASQGAGRFIILVNPAVTSLGSGAQTASLTLYPNPAAQYVNLSVQGLAAGTAAVSILDQLGRTVSQYTVQVTDAGTGRVVIENLPSGLYQVRVLQAHQSIQKQLVIQ